MGGEIKNMIRVYAIYKSITTPFVFLFMCWVFNSAVIVYLYIISSIVPGYMFFINLLMIVGLIYYIFDAARSLPEKIITLNNHIKKEA